MPSPHTADQLHAIHAMMARGHRSVSLEHHTLVLWGLAAALLILMVRTWITAEHYPVVWQRALATSVLISVVLVAIGFIDLRLTRRARRLRDETLSFVQLQLTKVWWLLAGMVVLVNLGMHFFGGGYMFFGVVFALMGIAFYVHGLFSQQMLNWIGVLLIVLGLGSVALKLPYMVMEWLAIFVFGIGFPLLALVLHHTPGDAGMTRRLAMAGGWLLMILLPTGAAYHLDRDPTPPDAPVVSLPDYRLGDAVGLQVVRLPAGTEVPLEIQVTGDVLDGVTTAIVPVRLSSPLEVSVSDGRPDGRFRAGAEPWKKALYNYRVRDLNLRSSLTRERGPEVKVTLYISTHN
jgi:type IV secretory pathway TrbD component